MAASRLIVRLDALVEAALAVFCLGLAVRAPQHGAWRLPTHVGVAVWWVVGVGLVGFAALLWRWSGRPTRSVVITLAAGNTLTGLLILAYVSIVDAGSAVVALLIAAGAALVGLGAAQVVIARRLVHPTATVSS